MAIPKEVLDDLSSRFLTSLPKEELEDPVRVCFQAEKAHWFYIDHLEYYTNEVSNSVVVPKCNVREFIRQIFQHCSFLQRHSKDIDSIFDKWREYKGVIPTHGAILLDESLENVLLVQGYHAKASWGFPKGKCNEEELPHRCAIREVKEETGFDITPLIKENDYLERHTAGEGASSTPNRLYIVPGVPRDYAFKPTTRNEIKECRWFMLDKLPTSRADMSKADLGIYPNNFYMVFPYVEQLKRWVMQRRGGRHSSAGSRIHGGTSSTTTTPTFANGDYRHHHQHVYYDQRPSRSSPRSRSISHSSPIGNSGGCGSDYNRQNYNSCSGYVSEKYQKNTSSAKQQQKKNKKTSTVVRQKLDFDSSGDSGPSKPSTSSKKEKSKTAEPTTETAAVVATPKVATDKVEVHPSQAWQQFHFNWEPIFSAM